MSSYMTVQGTARRMVDEVYDAELFFEANMTAEEYAQTIFDMYFGDNVDPDVLANGLPEWDADDFILARTVIAERVNELLSDDGWNPGIGGGSAPLLSDTEQPDPDSEAPTWGDAIGGIEYVEKLNRYIAETADGYRYELYLREHAMTPFAIAFAVDTIEDGERIKVDGIWPYMDFNSAVADMRRLTSETAHG